MPDENPETALRILPATSQLTIQYKARTIMMHSVSEAELESMAAFGNSVHLTLFGMSFGCLVGFATTLLTVEIGNPLTHATFAGLTFVSIFMSLYFALRAAIDHRGYKQKLREIKASTSTH